MPCSRAHCFKFMEVDCSVWALQLLLTPPPPARRTSEGVPRDLERFWTLRAPAPGAAGRSPGLPGRSRAGCCAGPPALTAIGSTKLPSTRPPPPGGLRVADDPGLDLGSVPATAAPGQLGARQQHPTDEDRRQPPLPTRSPGCPRSGLAYTSSREGRQVADVGTKGPSPSCPLLGSPRLSASSR